MTFDLDIDGFNRLATVKCMSEAGGVRFMTAGESATVLVVPADELVTLFTERSSSHRALAAALEATQTGQAAVSRAGGDLATRQADRSAFASSEGAGL